MYLSRNSLTREFDTSLSTVSRIIRYIRQGVAEGRYPTDGILYLGNHPRVDKSLFMRAMGDIQAERVAR